MSDQTAAIDPVRCFACGGDCDEVFGDGVCSHQCRFKREAAILAFACSLRRFVRRAEVAELHALVSLGLFGHSVAVITDAAGALKRLAALALESV